MRFLSIPVANDGLVEGTETFNLRLTNASPEAVIGAPSAFAVNILDNDAGMGFVSTNVVVNESSAFVTLTVRRYDDGPGAPTVDYFTSDGTAIAGGNYASRSGTIIVTNTFPRTSTITVPLYDQCGLINERVFTVTLHNPSADGAVGTNRIAVVRIVGNDQPGAIDYSFVSGRRADALALLPDGRIIGAATNIFRLLPDGAVDPSFVIYPQNTNVNLAYIRHTYDLEIQSDGEILAAGLSNFFSESDVRWFAGFRPDGSFHAGGLDAFFGGTAENYARIIEQPDGRILFARDEQAPGIRRLVNWTNDPSFLPGTGATDGTGVKAMALQPDGKILLGGDFTSFSGVPRKALVRLETNGAVDPTFYPPVGPYPFLGVSNLVGITEIELQRDGKILIVGGFTNLTSSNGLSVARQGLARLLSDGSIDATFDPGTIPGPVPWTAVRKLSVQPNGRILIGGNFTGVQGQPRLGVARLNANGTLDQTFFDPMATQAFNVVAMALQPDGRILVSDANSGVWRIEGDRPPRLEIAGASSAPLHLTVLSRPGKTYVLEASTNLVHWTAVQTNTAVDCRIIFTETTISPGRFFRAVQLTP